MWASVMAALNKLHDVEESLPIFFFIFKVIVVVPYLVPWNQQLSDIKEHLFLDSIFKYICT